MIKINLIDNLLKEQFYNSALPFYIAFLKNVYNEDDYLDLINYLGFINKEKPKYDDTKMRNILIGEKDKLIEIIEKVGPKGDNKHANNCYKDFANEDIMRSWAKSIGVISCPYCNLNYVNSSSDNSTRSEFDHFYPKSIFPYLCISMYNLIPCCHDCNHKKTNLNTYVESFAYPFSDEFGDNVVFDVDIQNLESITNNINPATSHVFRLKIVDIDGNELPLYFSNEVLKLRLIEKYLSKQYDINMMYNRVIKYNKNYCSSILKLKIFQRFLPDPYEFCGVISKEKWLMTTLAKLNYDIFNKFKR